ncbi:Oxidoreductase, molybdopterin-binding domain-containing protein [Calycina marina]|uniref:Nitrate reductase [NADPH] n=1 Tax=Calycina marina TaxID=1763456 RepID=A0A9P7Z609_9HELO|nr:Oxidoreductase, molybdopterin-binding domain-containing protein [Calycina marina]
MSARRLFTQLSRVTGKACRAALSPSPSKHSSECLKPLNTSKFNRIPPKPRRGVLLGALTSSSVIAVALGVQFQESKAALHEESKEAELSNSVPDIQKFRLAEVERHDGASENPWVTKGKSVYDITEWVGAHPGGEVILHAAGGSIDPYWNIFTIHKRQDVYDILEQYKIGEVDDVDLVDGQVPTKAIKDPFTTDPVPDERLHILTAKPCNAESPGEALSEFCTPNETFYVRNHMWVPSVEEQEHNLVIELCDGTEKTYSMSDLRNRFKQHKVTATLQCAGNRRKDMTKHARQTNGLQWTVGAISTAEWEGVKLRDVLADTGVNLNNPSPDDKHAQFLGLEAYGASIPLCKAIDPSGDVLLALKMNGDTLPREHGFPLRVIVPGNVAARSVKWLRKVVISDEESTTQWQRRDYKSFGPNDTRPDWDAAKSIQEMPVTSAITSILNGFAVAEGTEKGLNVEGYAYSGGGREIVRVDVSTDGGKTWDQAELLDDKAMGTKAWCWKRWRYALGESAEGKTTLMVKATDEAYNTQPQSYSSIYNARGNLATAWHSVDIKSLDKGTD